MSNYLEAFLPALVEKVDEASGAVTYRGKNRNADALTSDATWQISRELINGNETTTTFAGDGLANFDQIWDDRVALFAGGGYGNSFSTFFNGTNQDCNGGDIHNFDHANAFSVAMWVNPDNLAATRELFTKAGVTPNVRGYMLRVNATTGELFMQMRTVATNRTHTFDSAIVAGVWSFVVFTYAGGSDISGAHTYVNGVKNTSSPTGALSGTLLEGQPFELGSRNDGSFFSGNIDEVTVWNKALTQSEVNELYNGGAPFDPATHTAAANLVSHYRMGDDDVFPTISDNVNNNDLTMVNMAGSNFEMDVP